jgi:DNA helicase-2/ATP-dependent DNA helicase PcrA
VRPANGCAGRKLLIALPDFTPCFLLVTVGQSRVDALPERLSKRDPLGKRKRHRRIRELLSGHEGKVALGLAARKTFSALPIAGTGGVVLCSAPGVFPMSFRLFDLNDAQRVAVTQIDGPVLILAGAGTGKTRVITARIAYLIAQGVDPAHLLAVTFTNKAAEEMRERVGGMVEAKAAKKVTLSTFHALCVRILRADIERLGYKKNFSIYDQSDQLGLIRSIIQRTAAKDEKLDHHLAQSLISRAKNQGFAAPDRDQSLAGAVFARYQVELKQLNAVDFDDLLLLAVKLLREHPEACERWRARYRFLMVDEFQDTNRLQLDLVGLLAPGDPPNVCVVGDDDQSIYGWRGAEVSNILEFERHFPNPVVVKLEQNYRSTTAILHTANSLIRHNPRRRPKQLWSDLGTGDKIKIVPAPNDQEESIYVVGEIHRRQAEESAGWDDFAILYRTNAQSRTIEEQLRLMKIPYKLIGGKSFFDRREVKDLLAYLGCMLNADDDVSLLRIINLPPRGIGASTVERALAYSIEKKISLFKALGDAEFQQTLAAKTREAIKAFAALLDEYETRMLAVGADYAAVARQLIEEIGYFAELKRHCKTEPEIMSRETNVRDLVEDFERYQRRRPGDGPQGFLDELSLNRDRQERNEEKRQEEQKGVTLITLHAAKGLEFPHVYLIGLEEGILPHERSKVEGTLDEERRLLYVGITRARKTLTLSYCSARLKFGSSMPCTPSSFLRELSREHLEMVNLNKILSAPATENSARSHFQRMREMLSGGK